MEHIAGNNFADGPAGRRAAIMGTGLDVWEVISAWKAGGESYQSLRRDYSWLNDAQLRSALEYYRLFPEEVDAPRERGVLDTGAGT